MTNVLMLIMVMTVVIIIIKCCSISSPFVLFVQAAQSTRTQTTTTITLSSSSSSTSSSSYSETMSGKSSSSSSSRSDTISEPTPSSSSSHSRTRNSNTTTPSKTKTQTKPATSTKTEVETATITKSRSSLSQSDSEHATRSRTFSLTRLPTTTKTLEPTVTLSATETGRTTSRTLIPTPSDSIPATSTLTVTRTATESSTKELSPSDSIPETPTLTVTRTATESNTKELTPTSSIPDTDSKTETPSASQSPSSSVSETFTLSRSKSSTKSLTKILTPSLSLSESRSLSPTESDILTRTQTFSRTLTKTSSSSLSRSVTESPTESLSVSETANTKSATKSTTRTLTKILTPSRSESETHTLSDTLQPTETLTDILTPTETDVATDSVSASASLSNSLSLSESASPTASSTLSSSDTVPDTPSVTESASLSLSSSVSPSLSETITISRSRELIDFYINISNDSGIVAFLPLNDTGSFPPRGEWIRSCSPGWNNVFSATAEALCYHGNFGLPVYDGRIFKQLFPSPIEGGAVTKFADIAGLNCPDGKDTRPLIGTETCGFQRSGAGCTTSGSLFNAAPWAVNCYSPPQQFVFSQDLDGTIRVNADAVRQPNDGYMCAFNRTGLISAAARQGICNLAAFTSAGTPGLQMVAHSTFYNSPQVPAQLSDYIITDFTCRNTATNYRTSGNFTQIVTDNECTYLQNTPTVVREHCATVAPLGLNCHTNPGNFEFSLPPIRSDTNGTNPWVVTQSTSPREDNFNLPWRLLLTRRDATEGWGTVCPTGIDNDTAIFYCRRSGFPDTVRAYFGRINATRQLINDSFTDLNYTGTPIDLSPYTSTDSNMPILLDEVRNCQWFRNSLNFCSANYVQNTPSILPRRSQCNLTGTEAGDSALMSALLCVEEDVQKYEISMNLTNGAVLVNHFGTDGASITDGFGFFCQDPVTPTQPLLGGTTLCELMNVETTGGWPGRVVDSDIYVLSNFNTSMLPVAENVRCVDPGNFPTNQVLVDGATLQRYCTFENETATRERHDLNCPRLAVNCHIDKNNGWQWQQSPLSGTVIIRPIFGGASQPWGSVTLPTSGGTPTEEQNTAVGLCRNIFGWGNDVWPTKVKYRNYSFSAPETTFENAYTGPVATNNYFRLDNSTIFISDLRCPSTTGQFSDCTWIEGADGALFQRARSNHEQDLAIDCFRLPTQWSFTISVLTGLVRTQYDGVATGSDFGSVCYSDNLETETQTQIGLCKFFGYVDPVEAVISRRSENSWPEPVLVVSPEARAANAGNILLSNITNCPGASTTNIGDCEHYLETLPVRGIRRNLCTNDDDLVIDTCHQRRSTWEAFQRPGSSLLLVRPTSGSALGTICNGSQALLEGELLEPSSPFSSLKEITGNRTNLQVNDAAKNMWCRLLGFDNISTSKTTMQFLPLSTVFPQDVRNSINTPVYFSNVNCSKNASSLYDCNYTESSPSQDRTGCFLGDYPRAAVVPGPNVAPDPNLTQSFSETEGTLSMSHSESDTDLRNDLSFHYRLFVDCRTDFVDFEFYINMEKGGRLEARPNVTAPWGTVCSRGAFGDEENGMTQEDAINICRMSGFPQATWAKIVSPTNVTAAENANTVIYLQNLECPYKTGSNATVLPVDGYRFDDCDNTYIQSDLGNLARTTCTHADDVALYCFTSNDTETHDYPVKEEPWQFNVENVTLNTDERFVYARPNNSAPVGTICSTTDTTQSVLDGNSNAICSFLNFPGNLVNASLSRLGTAVVPAENNPQVYLSDLICSGQPTLPRPTVENSCPSYVQSDIHTLYYRISELSSGTLCSNTLIKYQNCSSERVDFRFRLVHQYDPLEVTANLALNAEHGHLSFAAPTYSDFVLDNNNTLFSLCYMLGWHNPVSFTSEVGAYPITNRNPVILHNFTCSFPDTETDYYYNAEDNVSFLGRVRGTYPSCQYEQYTSRYLPPTSYNADTAVLNRFSCRSNPLLWRVRIDPVTDVVYVRPSPSARWGTVCFNDMNIEAASTLCHLSGVTFVESIAFNQTDLSANLSFPSTPQYFGAMKCADNATFSLDEPSKPCTYEEGGEETLLVRSLGCSHANTTRIRCVPRPSQTDSPSKTFTRSASESNSYSNTESISIEPTPTITDPLTDSKTSTETKTETPSLSESASLSKSASVSLTESDSIEPTPTLTDEATPSNTETATLSATSSLSESDSHSFSTSHSISETASLSQTDSKTTSSTESLTESDSIQPTPTLTDEATPSNTETSTLSATSSLTESDSHSLSSSDSLSFTDSLSKSSSLTESVSQSITRSETLTESDSIQPTPTLTDEATPSATFTESKTESDSHSQSASNSLTETASLSPTSTLSQEPTPTTSESESITKTSSLSASASESETVSQSKSTSPSVTESASPSKTISETLTESDSIQPTPTLTDEATPSRTSTETLSESQSLSSSASRSISATESETESDSLSRSASYSVSETESLTASSTKSETDSLSETATPTLSSTQSLTESESLSETSTPTTSATDSLSESQSLSSSTSHSVSATESLSESSTLSPTDTIPETPSRSLSSTQSLTESESLSQSRSTTESSTPSLTSSATESETSSLSKSSTESETESLSTSSTASPSETESLSSTASRSVSESDSLSASSTPSLSASESLTESQSLSQSRTTTESSTPSLTTSATESETSSLSKSSTESETESLSTSSTASLPETISPTLTHSRSETESESLSTSSTPSTTASQSSTDTQSLSESESTTESSTPTSSSSPSLSETASLTQSASESESDTRSSSSTASLSESETQSQTASRSETSSESLSASDTPSATASRSLSASASLSESTSSSETESLSTSASASASSSRSISASESISESPTLSSEPTDTRPLTLSKSETISHSTTETLSESESKSASPSPSESESISESLSATSSPSITATLTSSASPTQSSSESFTNTETPSNSYSGSASWSYTLSDSKTPSRTISYSGSKTFSFTESDSPSSTASLTASPSDTETYGTFTDTEPPTVSASLPITESKSLSLSASQTESETASVSKSSSVSLSESSSTTASASISASESESISISRSSSPSFSTSETLSGTRSRSATESESLSETASTTTSKSSSLSESASLSATSSVSESESTSIEPTPSVTESETASLSASLSQSTSETPSISASLSKTASESLTESESTTATPTSTASESESISSSASTTQSESSTESSTETQTPSASPTTTETETESSSQSRSSSESLTETPSLSTTSTLSESESASSTSTPSSTPSESESQSATLSQTESATESETIPLTKSESLSESHSSTASLTQSESESESHSVSQSESETASSTASTSSSETVSESPSLSTTQSESQTETPSTTASHSESETQTETASTSPSVSESESFTQSKSTTASESLSESESLSTTPSSTTTQSESESVTPSSSATESLSESISESATTTPSATTSDSLTESSSLSKTQTESESISESLSETASLSTSASLSATSSDTASKSDSLTHSETSTESETLPLTESESLSESISTSATTTPSESISESLSQTDSESESQTTSKSASASDSLSESASISQSSSLSATDSHSLSSTSSPSETLSESETASNSLTTSASESESLSSTVSQSPSTTESDSLTASHSESVSESESISSSHSLSESASQTVSESASVSSSASLSSSESQTSTSSPSVSESPSLSESLSKTESSSDSISSSSSQSLSQSLSPSESNTTFITPSDELTLSQTESEPSLSGSHTESFTESQSASSSLSETATQSRSESSTLTETESIQPFPQGLRVNLATSTFIATSFLLLAVAAALPPISTLLQSLAAVCAMGNAGIDLRSAQLERVLVPFSLPFGRTNQTKPIVVEGGAVNVSSRRMLMMMNDHPQEDTTNSSTQRNSDEGGDLLLPPRSLFNEIGVYKSSSSRRLDYGALEGGPDPNNPIINDYTCVYCSKDNNDSANIMFGYTVTLVVLCLVFFIFHSMALGIAYFFIRDIEVAMWKVRFPSLTIIALLLTQTGLSFMSGVMLVRPDSTIPLRIAGVVCLILVAVFHFLFWRAAQTAADLLENKDFDPIFEQRSVHWLVSIVPGSRRKYFTQGLYAGPHSQRWSAIMDVVNPEWLRGFSLMHPVFGSIVCFMAGLSHLPAIANAISYVLVALFLIFCGFVAYFRPHRRPINLVITIMLSGICAFVVLTNMDLFAADIELVLSGVVLVWIFTFITLFCFIWEYTSWNKYFVALRERRAVPRPDFDILDCEFEKAVNPLEKDLEFDEFIDEDEDEEVEDDNFSEKSGGDQEQDRDREEQEQDNNDRPRTPVTEQPADDDDQQQQQQTDEEIAARIAELKQEKKDLKKKLTAWRQAFMTNNGREPTQTDIDADPEMRNAYSRYNQLHSDVVKLEEEQKTREEKAKASLLANKTSPSSPSRRQSTCSHHDPEEDDVDDDEDAEGPKESARKKFSKIKKLKLVAEKFKIETEQQQVEKEKKEKSKVLKEWKEEFVRRKSFQPNEDDLFNDQTISKEFIEYNRLKSRKQELEIEKEKLDKDINEVSAIIAEEEQKEEEQKKTELEELETKKTELSKKLNKWRKYFLSSNKRDPTADDIQQDAAISSIHKEYNDIKVRILKLTTPVVEINNKDKKSTPTPQSNNNPAASISFQKELDDESYKRVLNTKLNKWRKHFLLKHQRNPTEDDLKNDVDIAQVLSEYNALKKKLSAVKTKADDDPNNTSERPPQISMMEKVGNKSALKTNKQQQENDDDDEETIKKKLNKQLNKWRQVYIKSHDGKPPNEHDLINDTSISDVYIRYMALKGKEITATIDKTNNEDESSADARKKLLNRRLNAWKQQWVNTHDGVPPTEDDIMSDPQARSDYLEYMKIKNIDVATTNQQTSEVSGNPPTSSSINTTNNNNNNNNDTSAAAALTTKQSMAARKVLLNKRLNEWKSAFTAKQGTAPTIDDIQKDEEIGPIYKEYMKLKAHTVQQTVVAMAGLSRGNANNNNTTTSGAFEKSTMKSITNYEDLGVSQMNNNMNASVAAFAEEKSKEDQEREEEERRYKTLKGQIKKWQQNFEKENDRAPTVEDIEEDRMITAIYSEYTRLREERDRREHPEKYDNGNQASASPTGIFGQSMYNNTTATSGADDVFDSSPTAAFGNKSYTSFTAATRDLASEQQQKKMQEIVNSKYKTDEERTSRRKVLNKNLQKWKKAFVEEHGYVPSTDEIENDEKARAMYYEFLALKGDVVVKQEDEGNSAADSGSNNNNNNNNNNNSSANNNNVTFSASAMASDNNNTSPESKSEKKARRKFLKKRINDYKADFMQKYNREPLVEDIEADAEMKLIYEEYSSKKDDASPSPPALLAMSRLNQPLMNDDDDQQNNNNNDDNASPRVVVSSASFIDPLARTITDAIKTITKQEKEDKKRKKELGKSISEWKKSFQEKHAREPLQDDIEQDIDMFNAYNEYTVLKQTAHATSDAASPSPSPNRGGADASSPSLSSTRTRTGEDRKARLKHLLSEIEKWKEMWKAQFGSDPSEQDAQSDMNVRNMVNEAKELSSYVFEMQQSRRHIQIVGHNNNNNNAVVSSATAAAATAGGQQASSTSTPDDVFGKYHQQEESMFEKSLADKEKQQHQRRQSRGGNNNNDDDEYF